MFLPLKVKHYVNGLNGWIDYNSFIVFFFSVLKKLVFYIHKDVKPNIFKFKIKLNQNLKKNHTHIYTYMLTDTKHRKKNPTFSMSDTYYPNVQYSLLILPKDLKVLE